MIIFRVNGLGQVEWSNNGGHTWHDQQARMPRNVLRQWWTLMTAVGMQHVQNHTS